MDTRAGSYGRRLQTKAGLVNLKVPRLRKVTLETVIIERYRQRGSSIEEALIPIVLDICAFVISTIGLRSNPKWRNLLKSRPVPSQAEGFLDSASPSTSLRAKG